MKFITHSTLSAKLPWITNSLNKNKVKTQFFTVTENETAKIAYFQNSFLSKWITQFIKRSFNNYIDRESLIIEDSQLEEEDLFVEHMDHSVSFVMDVYNTHFLNPLAVITAMYLFDKLLRKEKEVSFVDFHKYVLGCLILASKMYEDDYVTTKGFHDGLQLNKWNIDFETVKSMEVETWSLLDCNIYANEKQVEDFFVNIKYHQKEVKINAIS
eukprot:gene7338-11657_t